MNNHHNNGIPPNGIPPGWIFYPYPALAVYPSPQAVQTSQALSLPAPPAPPPPEPEENLQLALPAQIKFVACHHCGCCGRPRSHAYHKEHPLIPGQVAPASTCRKCIKKQDKGEPIDSIMLSVRNHVSEKESSRSGQFYDPPSTEPSRGRLRSVSWRHVAPRGISRPRIEDLDGFTNDPSEPYLPPPAPSVPRSAASEKVSRALSARVSCAPSDKVSRATSSACSSQRTAHSGYASHTLPRREPKREIRETIEVRTRQPLSLAREARETRSIIKASDRPLYRTPTPDSHGEARHTHDNYKVRFECSPSRQRHALVRQDEQALAPYYRHVERRIEENAPEVAESTYRTYKRKEEFEEEGVATRLRLLHSGSKSEASSAPKSFRNVAKPPTNAGASTERPRGRNMLLIRRSPSPSPVRAPSPLRRSRPSRSGREQSKARPDYEAYRAYHSRPPSPPRLAAPPSRLSPPPQAASPPFGRGSFVGDPVGPWLNPQPHDNIAFSERSNNGSETSVGTGRKSARRGRVLDV